jgi:hypothetical protein
VEGILTSDRRHQKPQISQIFKSRRFILSRRNERNKGKDSFGVARRSKISAISFISAGQNKSAGQKNLLD